MDQETWAQLLKSEDTFTQMMSPMLSSFGYQLREWIDDKITPGKFIQTLRCELMKPDYWISVENLSDVKMWVQVGNYEFSLPNGKKEELGLYRQLLTFTGIEVKCQIPFKLIPISRAIEICREHLEDQVGPPKGAGYTKDFQFWYQLAVDFMYDYPYICYNAPEVSEKRKLISIDRAPCYSKTLLVPDDNEDLDEWNIKNDDLLKKEKITYNWSYSLGSKIPKMGEKITKTVMDILTVDSYLVDCPDGIIGCIVAHWGKDYYLTREQVERRKEINSKIISYQDLLVKWKERYERALDNRIGECIEKLTDGDNILFPDIDSLENIKCELIGNLTLHPPKVERMQWRDYVIDAGCICKLDELGSTRI